MARNDDNTAAGMALSQEDSMYLTPAASPHASASEDKDMCCSAQDEIKVDEDTIKHGFAPDEIVTQTGLASPPASIRSFPLGPRNTDASRPTDHIGERTLRIEAGTGIDGPTGTESTRATLSGPTPQASNISPTTDTPIPRGLAKVDLEMDIRSSVRSWDFTDKAPSSRTPSAMLQPYAKYVGTQQSGHHTYNVEVTILTVDMEQSNLSGFLKISNLTPEHPVLETFFTGEIVGGPEQRYSFRTMDPAWGTTEKVDMRHWTRFPAWRQFSSIAKRDMGFDYPLNGQAWYQQEHVYMRWKERFLAPDHRKSNLSGASFEGFYYICLNQMEGKISGVYFHSHSEQ